MSTAYIDIAFLVIFILFVARGALHGFVTEFFGFIAIFLGVFLGRKYMMSLAPYMENFFPEHLAGFISFIVIVLSVMLIVGIVANIFRKIVDIVFIGWLDALLGALFGFAKAVLVCAVFAFGLEIFFGETSFVQGSIIFPYMITVVEYFTVFLSENI